MTISVILKFKTSVFRRHSETFTVTDSSYRPVDCVWNVTAHAQKPDFVFRRNGRVHLYRRRRQFSWLLAAEVCASAVVMLDTPCSEVVWRVLDTHSIHQSPLLFPSHASPCAITFQLYFTHWHKISSSSVIPLVQGRTPSITTNFWGAFLKLQKAIIIFVCLSIRLSVSMEQLGSRWTDFHEIWYLSIFRKHDEKIQISLKLY
jgi:hypothetical protein